MTSRHLTASAVAMLMAGSILAGPLAAETVLNVVPSAPLRVLDPMVSTAQVVRTHGFMVFDTLVGMDADLQPQPQMADYTVSEDGMTYTFTLRDGLLWHDGTPVTVEDCIASLQRWGRNDGNGRLMMQHVAAIAPVSDTAFTIQLAKPFGHVLALLGKPSPIPPFMMPKRLADTPDGERITEMVGSGPFKFVADEYRPGDQTVYVKNEAYVPRPEPASWTAGGKVVNVDRIVLKTMPDMQTSLNALQSGDVDLVESVTIDLLPLLESNPDIAFGTLLPLGGQYTGQFNHRLPPFDNKMIRRAAIYALDQEMILQTAVGNAEYYTMCASAYGCTVPVATDAGSEYLAGTAAERMAKAQALLKEAGYDGTPVVMLQPTDLASLTTPPIVAAERLREAGFTVNVEPSDWATLQARKEKWVPVAEGGWNMFFTSWGIPGIWNPLVHTLLDGSGKDGTWAGWRVSPEAEELRAAYVTALDPEEQKDIASKLQQIAWDEGFYFNGGEYRGVGAWRAEIEGVSPGPLLTFWTISK